MIPSGAPQGSYPGGYPFNAGHMRAALARTGRRILLAFAALTVGSLLVLALLITAFLVHGGLLVVVVAALLAILAAGVAAAGALVWLAQRLWRRHAWIEAVPSVAGQPCAGPWSRGWPACCSLAAPSGGCVPAWPTAPDPRGRHGLRWWIDSRR